MKTLLIAALAATLIVPALAAEAPEGWSRPGGYYDQVKGGSLSKPGNTGCSKLSDTQTDPDGAGPLPLGYYCERA